MQAMKSGVIERCKRALMGLFDGAGRFARDVMAYEKAVQALFDATKCRPTSELDRLGMCNPAPFSGWRGVVKLHGLDEVYSTPPVKVLLE